jgi:hypothetical protein
MTEHKYNDRRHAFIEKMKVMKMATCHMGTWMMGVMDWMNGPDARIKDL